MFILSNVFFSGAARRLGHLSEAESAHYDTRRKRSYTLVCSTLCGAHTGWPTEQCS